MSETGETLRRILLAVDVSRDSLAGLDVALELAATLGGEVSGLFIEDTQLLAAGRLPLAREVGSMSGISRRIGERDLQDRLRGVASKARSALANAGARLKVPTSFQVGHGDVAAEILEAAKNADLVVLGKAGWSPGTFRTPGRTCLAILERSAIPVLIVEHGVTLAPPVVVVHDDTDAGTRALEFARSLSRRLGWELATFTAHRVSSGNDVMDRIQYEKPRLVVLPSSLPLANCNVRLKSPVVFVP